jgi:CRP/FNR family transcriptional regulator, anaerobic regulatory protein
MAGPDMNTELFLENMRKHIRLTEEEEAVVLSKLRPVKLKRREHLLKQGTVARDLAFVLEGCLRAYALDDNGFEHILQFAPAGWWISDMSSVISRSESLLNVDAIKPSEVLLLSREDQLSLFDEVPKLERYFRVLTENGLVSSRMRLIENLSLTARQRYQRFCQTYPNLINEIPQKYIASFIGVTPEFLSKIRGEKLS